MPAIRFLFNGVMALATVPPEENHFIEVRMHNGKPARFEFLGFICRHGINLLSDGSYAKMIAVEVSNGDGNHGDWRRVEDNQVALVWRVLHSKRGFKNWGVYGIVDAEGWPIVVTDKNYKEPKIKKATLYHLNTKGKTLPAPTNEEKSRA